VSPSRYTKKKKKSQYEAIPDVNIIEGIWHAYGRQLSWFNP